MHILELIKKFSFEKAELLKYLTDQIKAFIYIVDKFQQRFRECKSKRGGKKIEDNKCNFIYVSSCFNSRECECGNDNGM